MYTGGLESPCSSRCSGNLLPGVSGGGCGPFMLYLTCPSAALVQSWWPHSSDVPTGPCPNMSQNNITLAPKYLHSDYLKANVYTIWGHGPLNPKHYRTLIECLRCPKPYRTLIVYATPWCLARNGGMEYGDCCWGLYYIGTTVGIHSPIPY